MNPICGIHGKEMKSREGQYGQFWSCGIKNPDGSWCKYKPPQPKTPEQKFNNDLNQSAASMNQTKKDETITRIAIAKSMIESGNKYSIDTVREFSRWVALVEGRAIPLEKFPPAEKQSEQHEEQIPIDEIPF